MPPFRELHGRSPQKRNNGGAAGSVSGKKDACALLTAAEIAAVQGEPVSETRTSVRANGEMLISECLYQTSTSTKSVSVALATPGPARPSALTPRKFWVKQFHANDLRADEMPAADKRAQRPEPEGEEQGPKPRRMEGLGEEAYWVGTPITGALYVLEGDNFIRISVGGVREEGVRIEKSKALARAMVSRLHPHS